MASDKKQEKPKATRLFSTEMIDRLVEDAAQGLDIDMSPFWMGDVELRAANVVFEYTDEEEEEFMRCARDPVYFISNYCKFQNDLGRTLVKLREYQIELIHLICDNHYDERIKEFVPNNRNVITMASRQTGKTTTIASIFAWYLCFNVDKNVIVLANKQDTSKEILDKINHIFRGLPYWMKPGTLSYGKETASFDNGCKIITAATTASTSIGFTIHMLYLDEFAHIPNNIIEPFWRSVYPTMASSNISQCIISSTPNGTTNMFYDIWSKSDQGSMENSFKGLRVDYWKVPEHDDKWAEQMKKDFGEKFFAQEFALQFSVNSTMLLSGSDLAFFNRIKRSYKYRWIDKNDPYLLSKKIQWHPDFNPKDIDPLDKFVMMVDLAEGNENNDIKDDKDSTDYNVINIFKIVPNSIANLRRYNKMKKITFNDCVKLVQVGLFRDNENDEEYCANMTSAILYNVFESHMHDNVRVMVEMNFQGKNYLTFLKQNENFYDNVVIKTYHTKPVPGEKRHKKFGYITSSDKKYYCKKGSELVAKKRVIINEPASIGECSAFGKIKGNGANEKYGGIACHDDISITILNGIPRLFDETTFTAWIEDFFEDCIKDNDYKEKVASMMKQWDFENPDISDNMFESMYGMDSGSSVMPQMQNPFSQFPIGGLGGMPGVMYTGQTQRSPLGFGR